jgi:integrase
MLKAIVDWHYRQEDEQPHKWNPDLPPIPEKEQRWFTPVEAQQIVDAAEGQYRVLFGLAAATGLRFGELAGLHCEDVDLTKQIITVRRSVWKGRLVPTKTKAGFRQVFIDADTAEILGAHIEGQDGLVFKTRNNTPLANREVVFDHLYPVCD